MCESGLMQESQGFGRGREHLLDFRGRERTLRKNLRQILFGIFHHDVEKIAAVNLNASTFIEPNQMGMGQLRAVGPSSQLSGFLDIMGGKGFRRNQLDGRFLGLSSGSLGKKYRAVLGASQPLSQRELSINDPAFPRFPDLNHAAHRTRLAERLFYASACRDSL